MYVCILHINIQLVMCFNVNLRSLLICTCRYMYVCKLHTNVDVCIYVRLQIANTLQIANNQSVKETPLNSIRIRDSGHYAFVLFQIQGLCGNMDGSVDNEYTSRNQIQESLPAFASSFSDCQDNVYTDIDACKFNNKVAYYNLHLLTYSSVCNLCALYKTSKLEDMHNASRLSLEVAARIAS